MELKLIFVIPLLLPQILANLCQVVNFFTLLLAFLRSPSQLYLLSQAFCFIALLLAFFRNPSQLYLPSSGLSQAFCFIALLLAFFRNPSQLYLPSSDSFQLWHPSSLIISSFLAILMDFMCSQPSLFIFKAIFSIFSRDSLQPSSEQFLHSRSFVISHRLFQISNPLPHIFILDQLHEQ